MSQATIKYIFDYGDANQKEFVLNFDSKSMSYILPENALKTEWTNLENHQCANCPLIKEETPHCPVALGLYHVNSVFADEKSFRLSPVMVETAQRSYYKKVSLQEGLFSIFGLIISTSGCQHFNFLKPMARLHLPFSTEEETVIRSLSMNLIKKYFYSIDNHQEIIHTMDDFNLSYEQVKIANEGIIKRIRNMSPGDANKNAIVCLDNFATLLSMDLQENFSEVRSFLGM